MFFHFLLNSLTNSFSLKFPQKKETRLAETISTLNSGVVSVRFLHYHNFTSVQHSLIIACMELINRHTTHSVRITIKAIWIFFTPNKIYLRSNEKKNYSFGFLPFFKNTSKTPVITPATTPLEEPRPNFRSLWSMTSLLIMSCRSDLERPSGVGTSSAQEWPSKVMDRGHAIEVSQ